MLTHPTISQLRIEATNLNSYVLNHLQPDLQTEVDALQAAITAGDLVAIQTAFNTFSGDLATGLGKIQGMTNKLLIDLLTFNCPVCP